MPEIISKYPDVVLKILKDAKINCGTGARQQILTKCPADKFCSLPTGELCVYGVHDANQLTQLQPIDLMTGTNFWLVFLSAAVMVFLGGMLVGISVKSSNN